MKNLKHIGTYLEKQAKLNRDVSILLIVIGLIGSLLYPYLLGIALIVGGFFFNSYIKNYTNYKSGLEAEKLVTQSLSTLDDSYFLINDIKLPGSYGNIDHIVLGPNGVFVIETKNYRGQIICKGDEWIRRYAGGLKIGMWGLYWRADKDYDLESPSKQVKRNAVKVKQIIESSQVFKKPLNIWVEGIVVFTNSDTDLKLTNAAVPILKIDELCDYIKNKESKIIFSTKELESIGAAILRVAKVN